jgi:TolB-like protein
MASIAVPSFVNMSADPETSNSPTAWRKKSRGAEQSGAARHVAYVVVRIQRRNEMRTIGRTLGVASVLEGSVRKAGKKLGINVRPIKVADGYQLWSNA